MADKWLSQFETQVILNELKRRYRGEHAILDYVEMIECEIMSMGGEK